MRGIRKKLLSLISVGIMAISVLPVYAAEDSGITVVMKNGSYADFDYEYVPLDATIGIELTGEEEINVIYPDRIQIRKYPFSGTPLNVEFEEVGNLLLIKPQEKLEPNENYRIYIDGGSIEDQYGGSVLAQTFYFTSGTIAFQDLMFNNGTYNYILEEYVPRNIRVYPKNRYIEKIEVSSMKEKMNSGGMMSTVTNVDVITKGDIVERVEIMLSSNQVQTEVGRKFKEEDDKEFFDAGFRGVNFHESALDVTVRAFNEDGELIDEKLMLLIDEGGDYVQITEEYEYETVGNGYSLYDLITDDTLLQTMLNENKMDNIFIQLVETE